jgi:hydrogenase maturation protease
MPNLRTALFERLTGRVCLLGIGNVNQGDDGLGVKLAQDLQAEGAQLQADGQTQVVLAKTAPERYLGQVAQGGFDQVVFLDAVEFGGAPGSVVFLDAAEMTSRFPQISTHKLSLGVLAQLVEACGKTRAWLLGVQPASLKAGEGLTSPVQATLDLLRELLKEVMFFRLAHSNAAPAGVL